MSRWSVADSKRALSQRADSFLTHSIRLLVAQCVWLLLPVVYLSGCQRVPNLVKIGLVAPFEGRHRSVGYDAIYAARLAIREVNARWDTDDTRVLLVALDDGGDPELARQAAASLVLDPDVMAVVGHWLPETTAAAWPIYDDGELPLVMLGIEPFRASDSNDLPMGFLDAYAQITPFDEVAGPYAGPTYDALNLVLEALEIAKMNEELSRRGVASALEGLQYEGLTGLIYQP